MSPGRYDYVADAPLTWIDPLGLIRWRYYDQHTTTSNLTMRRGCTEVRFRLGHTCTDGSCGAWKLEYQAEAEFFVFIADWLSRSEAAETLAHEEEHVAVAVNNILSGLASLLTYEHRRYSSRGACEAAASEGVNSMRINVERGQARVDDYIGYLIGQMFQQPCR